MKFLKQTDIIGHVIAKLRQNYFKISIETSRSSPPEVLHIKGVLRNFAKFTRKHLCQSQISFCREFFENEKEPRTSFQANFCRIFLWKFSFCNITQTGQISIPECVYIPSYSAECIFSFMLGHLRTS